MNSVKLSNYYRLYAFSDYQSMRAAMPYMQRVVFTKKLDEVEEREARSYVQRIPGNGYKNYLEPISNYNATYSATRSLITALQLLYKSNGYAARYILIERC